VTFTIDLTAIDAVPLWAWVVAGVATWYMAAGVIIRRTVPIDGHGFTWGEGPPVFILWAVSPIWVAILAGWTLCGVLSAGLVRMPWRVLPKKSDL
jgi:hypothetical protein